jgi:hypothetical protein
MEGMRDRERPSVSEIHRYRAKEEIFKAVERKTGKDIEAIKNKKGDLRRLVMELPYRNGGYKGPQIGRLFAIDYGPVSRERRKLREKLERDRELRALMNRIERNSSSSE